MNIMESHNFYVTALSNRSSLKGIICRLCRPSVAQKIKKQHFLKTFMECEMFLFSYFAKICMLLNSNAASDVLNFYYGVILGYITFI